MTSNKGKSEPLGHLPPELGRCWPLCEALLRIPPKENGKGFDETGNAEHVWSAG